jgi:hypothetical protein
MAEVTADPQVQKIIGRRVRLRGDHPWAGESAEVVGFNDAIGMRVKLLRMDAMYGYECYVTDPKQFREERKGMDW